MSINHQEDTPQRTTYMLSSRGYLRAQESPHVLYPVSQCGIWKIFQLLMYVKSCSLGKIVWHKVQSPGWKKKNSTTAKCKVKHQLCSSMSGFQSLWSQSKQQHFNPQGFVTTWLLRWTVNPVARVWPLDKTGQGEGPFFSSSNSTPVHSSVPALPSSALLALQLLRTLIPSPLFNKWWPHG